MHGPKTSAIFLRIAPSERELIAEARARLGASQSAFVREAGVAFAELLLRFVEPDTPPNEVRPLTEERSDVEDSSRGETARRHDTT